MGNKQYAFICTARECAAGGRRHGGSAAQSPGVSASACLRQCSAGWRRTRAPAQLRAAWSLNTRPFENCHELQTPRRRWAQWSALGTGNVAESERARNMCVCCCVFVLCAHVCVRHDACRRMCVRTLLRHSRTRAHTPAWRAAHWQKVYINTLTHSLTHSLAASTSQTHSSSWGHSR